MRATREEKCTSRRSALKPSRVVHFCDLKFLMLCASSCTSKSSLGSARSSEESSDERKAHQDHVAPLLALENPLIRDGDLVGRDADLERAVLVPAASERVSLLLVAVVGHDVEARQKLRASIKSVRRWPRRLKKLPEATDFLELHVPVEQDRRRNDDKMRSPHALVAREMSEESDGLDRLPASVKPRQRSQGGHRLEAGK